MEFILYSWTIAIPRVINFPPLIRPKYRTYGVLGEGLIQECQFPTYRVEKSPENHVFGPQQGRGVQKWLESHNLHVLREVGVGQVALSAYGSIHKHQVGQCPTSL